MDRGSEGLHGVSLVGDELRLGGIGRHAAFDEIGHGRPGKVRRRISDLNFVLALRAFPHRLGLRRGESSSWIITTIEAGVPRGSPIMPFPGRWLFRPVADQRTRTHPAP